MSGRATHLLLSVSVLTVLCGCSDPSLPPPTLGVKDWKPSRAVGGSLEVRPLPPADQVLEDHRKWVESSTAPVARFYETVLVAPNQHDFRVVVRRDDTPMGRPEHTYVSFIYRDATNGSYEFSWHRLGRQNADFLKLGDTPKQVWTRLNWRASKPDLPLLEIVAFEGLRPDRVFLAEPGGVRTW